MPGKLGDLEPLYRWLRLRNETDPVEALLQDMEMLSKHKYIKNLREGVHTVITNKQIDSEVELSMREYMQEDEILNFHASYQAIGDKMYMSIARVGARASKTSLAICINEDDTIDVLYLEPDAICQFAAERPCLYGSISSIIVTEDGQIKNGFIRCETSFMVEHSTRSLLIMSDFRLSRTKPFYICIDNLFSAAPVASIGTGCQARWEAQCSR